MCSRQVFYRIKSTSSENSGGRVSRRTLVAIWQDHAPKVSPRQFLISHPLNADHNHPTRQWDDFQTLPRWNLVGGGSVATSIGTRMLTTTTSALFAMTMTCQPTPRRRGMLQGQRRLWKPRGLEGGREVEIIGPLVKYERG